MPMLVGRIWDRESQRPLAARVQVMASTGAICIPNDSIRKVGPGDPFFYADDGIVFAELFHRVTDHLFTLVIGEVQVKVGHTHTPRIEEALENKIVLERVNAGPSVGRSINRSAGWGMA